MSAYSYSFSASANLKKIPSERIMRKGIQFPGPLCEEPFALREIIFSLNKRN